MSGDTYNQPPMPSYGEGMAAAMKAQMEQLLGQGDYADIYKEAGFEGGNLGDILTGVEAPIRKQTAQIDTDVLRQTILGGEGKTTDQEGRVITGYTTPEPAGGGSALGGYQIVNMGGEMKQIYGGGWIQIPSYGLVDKDGSVVLTAEDSLQGPGYTARGKIAMGTVADTGTGVASLMAQAKKDGLLTPQQAEAGKKAEPIYETDPETGDPIIYKDDDGNVLSGQKVARSGDGMIDLMGDTRGVQESVQNEDYAQYVKDNPDLQAEFARRRQADEDITIEEFGQEHYEVSGKAEGRDLPMGDYSLQDAGRQAGFDESGEFRGLSALAEDIGRGGQQRAREADIADVERLGGRATAAYRAQGDLSGALAQARGVGSGGYLGLSAIPEDPLFTGAATGSLADRTAEEHLGIDAITSGGMQAAMASPAADLTAATSYDPSVGITGGQIGADALRKALMSDAETSLAGGLTQREERQISEAMKAQSTMMGRTFDQSAGIAEAKARTLEDRNRQALNRQYAQQVVGQEARLQESDLGRGLQAQLANQQATNRAAEYGVGAGLQREQAGAQFDQQTALANQAAKQEAARYTAQEAMQAKQMELGRQTAGVERQLTAEEKDIERIMRQQAMEEQYRQQGLGAERASAAQMVGLEQATSADPFQAILQRQGQNNLGAGGQLFGSAQYGLQSGPQYLNPEAGLGFISNQASNAANMYNAQVGADATRSAGIMGGLGSLAGGLFGGAGAAQGFGKLFS